MAQSIFKASLFFAIASLANAQGPPSGNPYSNGGSDNPYANSGDDDGGDSGFGGSGYEGFGPPAGINKMVAAHAICATVAFGLLLPSGGILIRLASFRGLWLVHGIFQIVAFIIFIAAFAMGIYMATHMRMMHNAHPIIGIIAFLILLFQPVLGLVHHFAFKKYSRRVVWSYAHIWLGRFVITLGIINGGLGLRLSSKLGHFAPKQSTIIGYSVGAGIMWLLYVGSAVYGESKRRKANYAAVDQNPPAYKRETNTQYA